MVVRDDGQWLAVVGIPLGTTPGHQQLVVNHSGKTIQLDFDVDAKQYDVQKLAEIKSRSISNPELDALFAKIAKGEGGVEAPVDTGGGATNPDDDALLNKKW